jgi:hypothetical protein
VYVPAGGGEADAGGVAVELTGPQRGGDGVLGLDGGAEGREGGGVAVRERQHGPRAALLHAGHDLEPHRADAQLVPGRRHGALLLLAGLLREPPPLRRRRRWGLAVLLFAVPEDGGGRRHGWGEEGIGRMRRCVCWLVWALLGVFCGERVAVCGLVGAALYIGSTGRREEARELLVYLLRLTRSPTLSRVERELHACMRQARNCPWLMYLERYRINVKKNQ